MLKPILLGSALLFAIPALAQTTNGTQDSGTATTTNDHDPTMEDDGTAEGNANATVSTQVNGGTTSASTGMGTSATTQGSSQSGMNHSGMNHGTMNHGSAAHGTTSTGTTSTGTMSGGTMSGGTGAGAGGYAGVGGPMQAAGNYPPCTRTRTDSCIQTDERGRRR